eukprot:1499515-Ditylum_brightwellii.AAC.2
MTVTKKDVAKMNAMDLNADAFPVDYAVIHKAQRHDKTADVKDPKNWLVVKFGNVPLLTCKGRIYLSSNIAKRVVAWYHLSLQHPGETHTYMTCRKDKYGMFPPPPQHLPEPWDVMQ